MNQPINPLWLDQLKSIGADAAQLESDRAVLQPESIQFMDRSDLCVVSIRGADAGKFLQSQTCNDHANVSADKAQLDGYCSPKGRLLALPWVLSKADGSAYYWLLPKDLVDAAVKRLTMFVLRDDVSITIEEDWAVMGLGFPANKDVTGLEAWLGAPSAEPLSAWESNAHIVLKARSSSEQVRTLLFGPADAIIASLKSCQEALPEDAAKPVWSGAASWLWGDIEAGVPSIVAATQDSFVPQMVNLEPLQGLSFTKGCYPGQEIVARMQYLGKLKRTMVRFNADAALTLAPGDSISAAEDENAGEVVSVALSDNASTCLAVIKTSADQSTFSANGVSLTVQALPYT